MKIKENKNLLVTGAVLIICFILIGLAGSIRGGAKSYEVKPEITLPEYRTDAARAIDAYERVMNRFINLTERNLTSINTDIKSIAEKLVLIDCKLTELSTRMARIEKNLEIQQSEKPVEKSSKDKTDVPDTQKVEPESL